jgi:hypothetical protein
VSLATHLQDLAGWSQMALLPEERVGLFVAFNASMTHALTTQRRTLAAFLDHSYPGRGARPQSAAHLAQPRLSVEQDSDVGGLAAGGLEPFVGH